MSPSCGNRHSFNEEKMTQLLIRPICYITSVCQLSWETYHSVYVGSCGYWSMRSFTLWGGLRPKPLALSQRSRRVIPAQEGELTDQHKEGYNSKRHHNHVLSAHKCISKLKCLILLGSFKGSHLHIARRSICNRDQESWIGENCPWSCLSEALDHLIVSFKDSWSLDFMVVQRTKM